VYSRSVREAGSGEDSTLTFGVSGKLWHGVLVFYDRETDSLWTQVEGRAIQGPREGQRLEHVSSVFTTWEKWVASHPDTLVLAKSEEAGERQGSVYASYFEDPNRLWLPELAQGLGGPRPKDLVWGATLDGDALAVSASLLDERGVVNAFLGEVPVAFVRDEATGGAWGVRRDAGPDVLVLEPSPGEDPGRIVVDAVSGERIEPASLPGLRLDRTYWYAWSRSHPGSLVLSR
jgi:hypothetical protein